MSTINQHVDGDGNTFSGSGDVQSNSFASHGGQMNIAQGANSIGQQINNYGSQPAPPPIPRQIPAPEPCFLYRYDELVWLNERLHPGKVAAVCGPGGMGKSALVAQAVSKLEPGRFPDGIIFYSFYGKHTADEALAHIVRSYDEAQQDTSPDAARRLLANKRALLILDGTEQADDLPALLRLRGSCGVLITSRKRTDALADRLDLKPLDEQPAAEVFRLYSGVAADDPSVAGICTLLGGWPVALRIAGRYLSTTGESAADYLRWLEQEPFKELAGGQHQEENAALLLRRSVDAVSDDARLALGLAGCLAFAPIAREPVAVILDGDERRARAALNELVNYGLLEKREERWQISHALVHSYARTELALSKESLERLAAYYISFCQEQSAAGLPGYARLDGERAHCLRLMESCLASKLWNEVQGLVRAIDIYLERQGYWTDELDAVEMRLAAVKQSGNRREEAWCLNEIGRICDLCGKSDKALTWFQQSLPISCEVGDRQGKAATLTGIAEIYRQLGDHKLALQYYEQSLSIQRKIGDQKGEGTTLNNIGAVYHNQEDFETALQYFKQSLHIRQEYGDKIGEGGTLNNIAVVYHAQGDYTKALDYNEQALDIYQQLGDRAGEAESRWNIGTVYAKLSDLAKAEDYISQAVRIAETIGHPEVEKYSDGLARLRAKRRG